MISHITPSSSALPARQLTPMSTSNRPRRKPVNYDKPTIVTQGLNIAPTKLESTVSSASTVSLAIPTSAIDSPEFGRKNVSQASFVSGQSQPTARLDASLPQSPERVSCRGARRESSHSPLPLPPRSAPLNAARSGVSNKDFDRQVAASTGHLQRPHSPLSPRTSDKRL